ncbi:Sulfoxide reductase catalytic subunit YedY [uncultured archaeon]|nr:Sulfoxide reductase catalytic subunit YedY [uncultured archaeon]
MHTLKTIESPDTKRPGRIPPGQRQVADFPVLHYGSIPRVDPKKWTLKLFGLVEDEKSLSLDEFLALPHVLVHSDIHCVTTWSRLDNLWEGVQTLALMNIIRIMPEAKFAIIHASGDFTTNLSLQDFFQEDVLLAIKHDGHVITPEHGYPVRLVVPRLYFWKSAKWVTGIEFTSEDRPGFWESHGYHNRGDPWLEERYS